MLYVVSACLAGHKCRYDGKYQGIAIVEQLVKEGLALALCPELLGGLGVPRAPCEFRSAKSELDTNEVQNDEVQKVQVQNIEPNSIEHNNVEYNNIKHNNIKHNNDESELGEFQNGIFLSRDGLDCSSAFRLGAHKSLTLVKEAGCKIAILKARSPSCGIGQIYDGTFTKTLLPSDGIFAHLLRNNGLSLYSEETFLCQK